MKKKQAWSWKHTFVHSFVMKSRCLAGKCGSVTFLACGPAGCGWLYWPPQTEEQSKVLLSIFGRFDEFVNEGERLAVYHTEVIMYKRG